MTCWRVKSAAAGFTLLEILVAVTIIGMAYLAIQQNFSMSLRNITRAERTAGQLLESQLAMDRYLLLDNLDDDEIEGETYVEGSKYRVILFRNEEGVNLSTLVLRKM